MTSATAAANTASSHASDLILKFRSSPWRALAPGLVAAHRVEAFRDGRHLEADGHAGELLELRHGLGGRLRARLEVALHPRDGRAQVLAVAGFVTREERRSRVEEPQAQVLAHEIGLRRRQQRRLASADAPHDDELREL